MQLRQRQEGSCLIALKASGTIEQVTAMSSLGAALILTAGTAAQEAAETGLRFRGYTQNKVSHLLRFWCFGALRLAG